MKTLNLNSIKQRRNDKKITLQEMAELLGFKNASTYLKYERGNYQFKAEQLPLLANILECNIEDLFFEDRFAKTAKLLTKTTA